MVRSLSFRAAMNCEYALEERCRCRCKGKAHGRKRGAPFSLPRKDPHHVDVDRTTMRELLLFYEVKLTPRQPELFGSAVPQLMFEE